MMRERGQHNELLSFGLKTVQQTPGLALLVVELCVGAYTVKERGVA